MLIDQDALEGSRPFRSKVILTTMIVTALTFAGCSRGSATGPGVSTTANAGSGPAGPTAVQLAEPSQCPWSACAQVLSSVAAGAKVTKLPRNLTPSLQEASADLLTPAGFNACEVGESATVTLDPCVDGTDAKAKRMVLIGDSHALMWSRAIAAIARRNGYNLLLLIKIPCPLPMVPFWNAVDNTPNTECTTWKKWAFTRIDKFDPSLVIATTEDFLPLTEQITTMSQAAFSAGFVTTLDDLKGPGRRVVVLGDIPFISPPGPICLAAHESDVQACSNPTTQAVVATHDAAEEAAARTAGASYINVVPWLCTPALCPTIINSIDVYSDSTHITSTYGEALEPVLSEALQLK